MTLTIQFINHINSYTGEIGLLFLANSILFIVVISSLGVHTNQNTISEDYKIYKIKTCFKIILSFIKPNIFKQYIF